MTGSLVRAGEGDVQLFDKPKSPNSWAANPHSTIVSLVSPSPIEAYIRLEKIVCTTSEEILVG